MESQLIAGTRECIADFAKRFKGDFKFRNKLCEILGINTATGHEWFDNGVMPEGENLVKLRIILELNGYALTEFADLDPLIWDFGKIAGLGIIPFSEAYSYIGLANKRGLLRVISGKCGISEEKMKKIKDACEKHASQLKTALKELSREVVLEKPKQTHLPISKAKKPVPVASNEVGEKAEKVRYLLLLLEAELRYFRDGKPEDREALRAILDASDIGYISSLLGMLGEEGAFQRWKSLSTYRFNSFHRRTQR